MKFKYYLLLGMAPVVMSSCGASKKLKAEQARYQELNDKYTSLQGSLKKCEDDNAESLKNRGLMENEIANLNKQIAFLKENNTSVLNQLKDLSVISGKQAESIKKSLDNIGAKDDYIQSLQSAIARKDSMNMALVMNLKGALANVNDSDVEIKVDKGVVLISLSDKMLFKSGSYDISEQAQGVLAKVAQVLNNQPDLEILIEGHTDNVPIKKQGIKDNWDLSVLRSTAITRVLQNTYKINPARITAGGRGEYVPLMSNDTPEGKAVNRRTRIIILPQLDQFFKLLEKKS